jgi:hypothetical protein
LVPAVLHIVNQVNESSIINLISGINRSVTMNRAKVTKKSQKNGFKFGGKRELRKKDRRNLGVYIE